MFYKGTRPQKPDLLMESGFLSCLRCIQPVYTVLEMGGLKNVCLLVKGCSRHCQLGEAWDKY